MTEKQLEQMIAECLPGGYNCDPQAAADAMREWHAKYVNEEKGWKSKYMDVADAITRESHGVEDLCRQAREIRKAAYDKDGTPWSMVFEWWRAKFEAAEGRVMELLGLKSKHDDMRNALACLVCSGPSHPNEINLSPEKTERYFDDMRRAQILILGPENAKAAGLVQ